MNKRVLLLLLASFLLIVFTACSENTSTNQTSTDSSSEQNPTNSEENEVNNNFPEKNITFIAPYAPGGGTDRVSRILAEAISEDLPRNVNMIVENRPGGSSTIGLTHLYNAKPDGYTLAVAMETGLAIKTNTDDLDYDWDSFTEISTLVTGTQVFVVEKDSPWDTAEEWLEYVENNPGEFRAAIAGIGSIGHIALEEIKYMAGLDLITVPYEGTGPTVQALLAGDVQGTIVATSQVEPELMKVLFDIGETKSEDIDAPIFKELGFDVGTDSWIGLIAPPGLPDYEFQVIHDLFEKALEDPNVIEKIREGQNQPYFSGPEEFQNIIERRYKINEEVLKNINMKQ